jgi:virulence-associated protein VagC
MRSRVTDQGLLIPKAWLADADEVEILREEDRVVVVPVRGKDPIFDLGKHPIKAGVDDASANHDRYLYGS